ncbi:MAG: hypothetical protein JO061_16325 [Acidobacteriaceae bacterium]|nr:hypothetical protein [Acidobacteriaceae bacterium]
MSLSRQQRRAAERQALKDLRKETSSSIGAMSEAIGASAISPARLQANRANAHLSTGPRTEEGKAASSRNSFKHGLYSKELVIPGEDPAELDSLKADLIAEHQPGNTTEEILVNEMAEHYWRLKRFRRVEAALMSDGNFMIAHASAIQRFMTSAERGFHKALKTLREVQKARGFVPTILSAAHPETSQMWGGLAEGNLRPIGKSASPSTLLPSVNTTAGFVPSKAAQAAGPDPEASLKVAGIIA